MIDISIGKRDKLTYIRPCYLRATTIGRSVISFGKRIAGNRHIVVVDDFSQSGRLEKPETFWLDDILSDYLEHSSLSLDCCAKASRGKVKSKRISSTDDVIASESLEKKEISVLRKLGFGKPFLLLSPCYVLVPPCCILTILRWGKQKTLPLKKKK